MPGTLILGYHSIAEPVRDTYSLCVTPQHFREQLEALSEVGRVISLQELVRGLQERRLPRGAAVLTFDDGYADVLHRARPLLERYQAPATVFVTTGALGREFWWDKLARVYLSAAEFPEQLSLQWKDGAYEWVSVDPRQLPRPDAWRDSVQSVYRSLLPLSPVERDKAIAQLEARSGPARNEQPSRRALTGEELIELVRGDLIEVGAHTVTHPLLAGLPIPEQRTEILDGKLHLEELLGRPATSFAYPNGSWSHGTQAIVRESGYICACASHKDVVWQGIDRFRLPRFWVEDWDGDEFSRRLRVWLPA